MNLVTHGLIALLRLLGMLPLALQALLGNGLGRLLYRFAGARRRVALRNLELCLPELGLAERAALARAHFRLLGRSLLERGLLWYASPARLRRLIRVEGDVGYAERTDRAVMWLVPHFIALDVAGAAVQLFQSRRLASIYQSQSNPLFDAALRRGRLRFGGSRIFSRHGGALPLMRALKEGDGFFNLPDMDFGLRDAAFVPFFGVPAATLLAPARIARALHMTVQPIVAEILPGGAGYRLRFLPPWEDFPGADDDEAAMLRLNRWIEAEVRRNPAQYLWVHKRFKTTPPGEAARY